MRTTRRVDGIALAVEIHGPEHIVTPVPSVIVCHGIPSGPPAEGDPGYRPLAKELAKKGFLAVLFNFRGCGASEGNIDLAGWCRDLAAIIDLVDDRTEVDRRRLSLLGFSGGAAVACCVAAQDKRVASLALAACPAEFSFLFKRDEAEQIIKRARETGSIREESFPPDPGKWLEDLLSIRAESCIGKLAGRPVLLLHGTGDELIPVEHAHRLFALAGEPKELVLLEGAGHRLRQEPAALEAAVHWLCRQNGLD